MAENSPLNVLAWIRRLGPNFKDSIAPCGLSCVFPYHQIRMDEPLLHAVAIYQVPSQHVFHFNGIELCPTIKEFVAIIGESEIDNLIFPTMGMDLPSLLQVMLSIPSVTANRWCVFDKLNLRLVSNRSTYAGCCPRMWVESHFGLSFPKIDFCLFKMLFFPFLHSSSQFNI